MAEADGGEGAGHATWAGNSLADAAKPAVAVDVVAAARENKETAWGKGWKVIPAGELEDVVGGGIWQTPGFAIPEDADDHLLDAQVSVVREDDMRGELDLHAIFAAEDGAVARGRDAGLARDDDGADPILPALADSSWIPAVGNVVGSMSLAAGMGWANRVTIVHGCPLPPTRAATTKDRAMVTGSQTREDVL